MEVLKRAFELLSEETKMQNLLNDDQRAAYARAMPDFKSLLGLKKYLEIVSLASVDLNGGEEIWVLATANELLIVSNKLEASYLKETIEKLEIVRLRSFSIFRVTFKSIGALETSGAFENEQSFRVSHRNAPAFDDLIMRWNSANIAQSNESFEDKFYHSIFNKVLKKHSLNAQNKWGVVWRLLTYLRPYKKHCAIGVISSLLLTLMVLVPSRVTGILIDDVFKPGGTIAKEEALQIFYYLVGALALSFVLREFFAWLRFQYMSIMGEFVATDLRRDLYAHMQTLGLDFYSSKSSGSLVSRITSDTDRLWDFIAFGVVEVFVSSLMLLGIGAVLLSMDWRLGLVMLIPIPFLLFSIYWHSQRMQKLFLRIWRKWSKMSGLAGDSLAGIRVVKAFHRGSEEVGRFMKANSEVLKEAEQIHHAWTRFWPALMFGIHSVIIAVWWLAGPRLLGFSEPHLSVGTFISFIIYAGLFVQPIEVIGQISRMMNRAVSSAHRVFEILDMQNPIVEKRGAQKMSIQGNIEFKSVSFSYDGLRQVLNDVNFKIRQGEMIGVVGPTGSGKSTLINLLMRFFEVSRGQILIDGVSLQDLDLKDFRSQVGMVLQDSYLFHGSILENIRYGKPEASLSEVLAVAKAARVHDFVLKLPHAYDTKVGERGHSLSGGERQRVAIARALLTNPRILILDEATSAVDTETEVKITEALNEIVKGRTVIAIAHRLSTLKKADRLLVFKDGKIVESGTHLELMSKEGGLFQKLSTLQRPEYVNFENLSL